MGKFLSVVPVNRRITLCILFNCIMVISTFGRDRGRDENISQADVNGQIHLAAGLRYTQTSQLWDDYTQGFNNADSLCYYYNDENQLARILNYTAEGNSGWYPASQTIYNTYNTGHLQSILIQNWDNSLWQWYNAVKDSFEYDTFGRLIARTTFDFSSENADWEFNHRILYTYGSDSLIEMQTEQKYIQNSWQNRTRYTSGYDSLFRLSSYLSENWNDSAQSWKPEMRSVYFYDSVQPSLNIYTNSYLWNPVLSDWYLNSRWSKTYNAARQVSSILFENYDSTAASFYYGSLQQYSYNSAGELLSSRFQNWDVVANDWVNENRDFYYYFPFTEVLATANKQESIYLYPNPASGFFYIRCSENSVMPLTIQILDMQGRLVKEVMIQVNEEESVPVSLPQGIYVCRSTGPESSLPPQKLVIR